MKPAQILYTTVESVQLRLEGKVRFQQDPNVVDDGEMSNAFLCQLIKDAETDVEGALRGRYAIPFQSARTKRYADLPDHSQRVIRRLVDAQAVMLILATDFGRSGKIDGSKYADDIEKQYNAALIQALGHDKEAASSTEKRFRRTPPLDDMLLAPGNTKADDGRKGMIINTDSNPNDAASYAESHINDPSRGYPYGRRP